MPSIRSTIIIVVIAVVSSIAALVAWQKDRYAGAPVEASRRVFAPTDLPVDDVRRIIVSRGNEPEMLFERGASGTWRQVQPFDHPVDPFSMRQLVIEAANLESALRIAPADLIGDQSPQALSLEPPLAKISYEWEGGSRDVLLGRPALGGRAYVRLGNDGDVHVVGQGLHDRALASDPKEWRRRELFEHAGVDSRVVALTGNETYGMIREGRTWKLERPIRTRLDQQSVEEFLALLAAIEASDFIADQPQDLAPFGLTKPALEFTVVSLTRRIEGGQVRTDEIEERLLIGSPRDVASSSYFAMVAGRPVVIALPRAVVDRLRAVGALVAMTACGVNPADVKAIRISGEVEFTIHRRDDDPTRWYAPDRDGAEVPASTVDVLLGHLTQTMATTIEQGLYPLDREVAYVTMMGFDGLPLDTVRLARREDGAWLTDNGDSILRVFAAGLELPLTPAAFGL